MEVTANVEYTLKLQYRELSLLAKMAAIALGETELTIKPAELEEAVKIHNTLLRQQHTQVNQYAEISRGKLKKAGLDASTMSEPEVPKDGRHLRSCPAYGNYQPPYEECTCGAEKPEAAMRPLRRSSGTR